MKTAILISGHARTFACCYRNQRWMVYRHFEDPHFFVSVVDDEDAEAMELLRADYPADRVFIERVKQPEHIPLPAGCPPEEHWVRGQPFMHEPYAISVSPQAVLKQLWHLLRVWEFMQERAAGVEFDRYVRVRPDLWFHSFTKPDAYDISRVLPHGGISIVYKSCHAWVPWWGRFGGCNDRFAVLRSESAKHYFRSMHKIETLISCGAPLHPESLIKHSLESGAITLNKLAVEFSTLRKNGEMRPPEYLMGDIAEGVA